MRPALSVVVPTCGRPTQLERMLSALEPTTTAGDVEVIVVDDGGSEATEEVVARHPHASYLRQQHAGPAVARNRGWRAARSELVAFIDDDTVPAPGWADELVRAMAADGLDGAGGRIEPLVRGFMADFVQAEGQVAHAVEDDGSVRYLVTANAAYRREVLETLDGFDEGFHEPAGEDTDLALRARQAGYRLGLVDGAVIAHDHRTTLRGLLRTYRKHGRSRTQVVTRNPAAGWGARRWKVIAPAHWRARCEAYRATGRGPIAVIAYAALHAVGLAAYVAGIAQGRRCARAAADAAPAARRVDVLCSGLGHVTRGYETFSREVAEVLAARPGRRVRVLKGAGPREGRERAVACLRRDGATARRLAVWPGRRGGSRRGGRSAMSRRQRARALLRGRLTVDPYEVEQVTFALAAALRVRRSDVVVVSDVLVAKVLARLRPVVRGRYRIVFSNGAPWPPPYPFADVVQHLTVPAHEAAVAAPPDGATHRLVPYGFQLPADPPDRSDAARRAARRRLGLPVDGPLLVSVGALNLHHKRHDHLVAEVAAASPAPHLVIVGAEEPEAPLVRAAAAEAMGDRCTVRSVPAEEVALHYQAADAFVLASLTEGLPRVLVEALAAGLPILVHPSPENRWVLGEQATYVDMTVPGALADAVTRLLAADEPQGRAAARWREARRRFSWERVGPELDRLVEDAACQPPRR